MSDNLETESVEEVTVSDADVFYNDAEPVQPTALAEEEVETETEAEEEVSEVEDDQPQAESEDDEEVEVFDQPNDFAKYEYDEESGLYEFKSMGKKVKVNTETLINNFQGKQKLNVELENLAKAKKGEFDGAKAVELETLRSEATKLQELSQKLESLITDTDEKIDWEDLRQYDMPEYTKQRELQQERKDALEKSNQERGAKIQERRTQVVSEEGAKLAELIPEWKDPKVFESESKAVHAFALTRFSQEEINHLHDHRFWLMMKESSELATLKAKQKSIKEVKKLPTVVNSKRGTTTKKKVERSDADIFYS
jgi:hypothetical protein